MNKNKPSLQQYLAFFHDKKASRFLIILLSIDLIFVILHYINALTPLLDSDRFSIGIDNGYAEIFQYTKFFSVIVFLIYILKKTNTIQYLAWIILFGYLLIDDSIRIHDRFGSHVALKLNFDPPFGLRLMDLGELAVSVFSGIILISIIFWAYQKGSLLFRSVSRDLFLLLFILVFFGVGMDMIHMIIIDKVPENMLRGVNSLLGLFEDGGEMVSLSFILWYTYFVKIKEGKPEAFLCDLFRPSQIRN